MRRRVHSEWSLEALLHDEPHGTFHDGNQAAWWSIDIVNIYNQIWRICATPTCMRQ